MTVILREVSRSPKSKAKVVFSLRLEEDDVEFLRTLSNASEFIRQAIEEEKRRQRMLDVKGIPFEIIHEIAEHYTKHTIELFNEEDYLERLSINISSPLYHISELTLTCPNPYHPDNDTPLIPVSKLDSLIEELQSKEAKAFFQRIRDKVEATRSSINPECYDYSIPPIAKEPLSEDELDTIRKIYDEAKMLLEQGYRKKFHKLLPADWHLTIFDCRSDNNRLSYKLP